jgi:hypothetical protein
MWIQNPDNLNPSLPTIWGIPPISLHRGNPDSISVLKYVFAHYPQYYDSFVAFLVAEDVWGKRISILFKEAFLEAEGFNPQHFFTWMMPGAIKLEIESLSNEFDWKEEWDSAV